MIRENVPNKLNIILFCNRPSQNNNANTVIDHVDAFSKYSKHNIFCFSNMGNYPKKLDLNKFDAAVIHYSSHILSKYYISPKGQQLIKEFKGLKILFLQDECRRIYDVHKKIADLGIHVLFTCIPEDEIEKVYPSVSLPDLIKVNNLTGYVSESLLRLTPPPIENRPIDVGYRARKLPFWCGRLAVEKWKIVDDFLEHTQGEGLLCDLSYDVNKRFYGDKWLQFLQSCKVMLGVESGTSVIDFTGDIESKVDEYQRRSPNCTFEEVFEKYLKDYDGKISMNQISPRCFEAIALKTPLVLFEGRYSDILLPGKHYISLKKDFSNVNEVVSLIKDTEYLQKMADCAYEEIALGSLHTYKTFIQRFDKVVSNAFIQEKFPFSQAPYSHEDFLKHISAFSLTTRLKRSVLAQVRLVYNRLPSKIQHRIKKFVYQ